MCRSVECESIRVSHIRVTYGKPAGKEKMGVLMCEQLRGRSVMLGLVALEVVARNDAAK